MNPSVLVVDDERSFRVLAEEALGSEGFDVRTAATLAKARTEVEQAAPDVVILDRRLPDGDGIDFLRALRADDPTGPLVIVVTAYGDVQNAVDALRAGAWDYLTKPVQVADLVVKLRKVLEARGLRDRLALAKTGRPPTDVPLKSPAMREVLDKLRTVSQSPLTPVFLVGPSGAGKQYAAELLHRLTYAQREDDAPFVEVNCAALPAELVESELFGHEKGSFTDAKTTRRGLIEIADGGTLFLDEVTELPERSQAKLLKFLDTMRFRRVGGQREMEVGLRVVAASNQDVGHRVAGGMLREDLYHRLAVFLVSIPPLASRREDIADLARAFARYFAARIKKRITGISAGALGVIESYDYPGNVRELRNLLERAVILAAGPEIAERDVVLPDGAERSREPDPQAKAAAFFGVGLGSAGEPPRLEEIERAYVARVLEHCEGRRMAAAEALGISYPTFLKRLRELGLE